MIDILNDDIIDKIIDYRTKEIENNILKISHMVNKLNIYLKSLSIIKASNIFNIYNNYKYLKYDIKLGKISYKIDNFLFESIINARVKIILDNKMSPIILNPTYYDFLYFCNANSNKKKELENIIYIYNEYDNNINNSNENMDDIIYLEAILH
tara:strand:+ start:1197 stop:1655 length:459 start_codon:yes stop_codon:yes gene_type:complete